MWLWSLVSLMSRALNALNERIKLDSWLCHFSCYEWGHCVCAPVPLNLFMLALFKPKESRNIDNGKRHYHRSSHCNAVICDYEHVINICDVIWVKLWCGDCDRHVRELKRNVWFWYWRYKRVRTCNVCTALPLPCLLVTFWATVMVVVTGNLCI